LSLFVSSRTKWNIYWSSCQHWWADTIRLWL
jgi:hypothetical protein